MKPTTTHGRKAGDGVRSTSYGKEIAVGVALLVAVILLLRVAEPLGHWIS